MLFFCIAIAFVVGLSASDNVMLGTPPKCASQCQFNSDTLAGLKNWDLPKRATFAKYDVNAFNNLGDVDQFSWMTHDLESVVRDAGTLISKHGVQDLVGITTIHKHFPLLVGEKLVVYPDPQDTSINALRAAPQIVDQLVGNNCTLVPYMFKFVASNDFAWVPLQYFCDSVVGLNGGSLSSLNSMMRKSNYFDTFLNEIGTLLTATRSTHLFGIYWRYDLLSSLRKKLKKLTPSVALMEQTDMTAREQFLTIVDTRDITNSIVTHYAFSNVDLCATSKNPLELNHKKCPIIVPPTACKQYCPRLWVPPAHGGLPKHKEE